MFKSLRPVLAISRMRKKARDTRKVKASERPTLARLGSQIKAEVARRAIATPKKKDTIKEKETLLTSTEAATLTTSTPTTNGKQAADGSTAALLDALSAAIADTAAITASIDTSLPIIASPSISTVGSGSNSPQRRSPMVTPKGSPKQSPQSSPRGSRSHLRGEQSPRTRSRSNSNAGHAHGSGRRTTWPSGGFVPLPEDDSGHIYVKSSLDDVHDNTHGPWPTEPPSTISTSPITATATTTTMPHTPTPSSTTVHTPTTKRSVGHAHSHSTGSTSPTKRRAPVLVGQIWRPSGPSHGINFATSQSMDWNPTKSSSNNGSSSPGRHRDNDTTGRLGVPSNSESKGHVRSHSSPTRAPQSPTRDPLSSLTPTFVGRPDTQAGTITSVAPILSSSHASESVAATEAVPATLPSTTDIVDPLYSMSTKESKLQQRRNEARQLASESTAQRKMDKADQRFWNGFVEKWHRKPTKKAPSSGSGHSRNPSLPDAAPMSSLSSGSAAANASQRRGIGVGVVLQGSFPTNVNGIRVSTKSVPMIDDTLPTWPPKKTLQPDAIPHLDDDDTQAADEDHHDAATTHAHNRHEHNDEEHKEIDPLVPIHFPTSGKDDGPNDIIYESEESEEDDDEKNDDEPLYLGQQQLEDEGYYQETKTRSHHQSSSPPLSMEHGTSLQVNPLLITTGEAPPSDTSVLSYMNTASGGMSPAYTSGIPSSNASLNNGDASSKNYQRQHQQQHTTIRGQSVSSYDDIQQQIIQQQQSQQPHHQQQHHRAVVSEQRHQQREHARRGNGDVVEYFRGALAQRRLQRTQAAAAAMDALNQQQSNDEAAFVDHDWNTKIGESVGAWSSLGKNNNDMLPPSSASSSSSPMPSSRHQYQSGGNSSRGGQREPLSGRSIHSSPYLQDSPVSNNDGSTLSNGWPHSSSIGTSSIIGGQSPINLYPLPPAMMVAGGLANNVGDADDEDLNLGAPWRWRRKQHSRAVFRNCMFKTADDPILGSLSPSTASPSLMMPHQHHHHHHHHHHPHVPSRPLTRNDNERSSVHSRSRRVHRSNQHRHIHHDGSYSVTLIPDRHQLNMQRSASAMSTHRPLTSSSTTNTRGMPIGPSSARGPGGVSVSAVFPTALPSVHR
jgi:hypothetical protein